jgi:hypothetical protein
VTSAAEEAEEAAAAGDTRERERERERGRETEKREDGEPAARADEWRQAKPKIHLARA